ncbi:Putative P-type ATPase, HAD superfamily, P-type ATPase, transmembrane domain superfamily [Colletotrichum destructivum]|uniref:Calcium-transporting ATPase 2 n=1 Tax=Colletotrichum destructivum TaxID=34406 RepID=A0AAX4I6X8_9PEZI|nr:Putative P-type ATPase, HAD superfamily, P-type ATPase, transmembrane domain superfamily [Colletotrichum destructivum]
MDNEITPAPPIGVTASNQVNRQDTTAAAGSAAIQKLSNEDNIPGSPFAFSPTQLCELIENRNPNSLIAFEGLTGLATGLLADIDAGLGVDENIIDGAISTPNTYRSNQDMSASSQTNSKSFTKLTSAAGNFTDRRRIYGENRVPGRKPKTFLQLLWMAFNDKLMFLLTASATVSLALGIYQSVADAGQGTSIEWVEGVAIIVAVAVIVLATAINDYQKNSKFQNLNQKKEERTITVIRSGRHRPISIFDILVGDVLHLEAGEVAPADGVLVQGFGIQWDESALTGESDLVAKSPVADDAQTTIDPFILGGTKITAGVGKYLVLAVGVNSSYGRIMMSLRDDIQETPLQQKLGVLAKYIITFGLAAGAIFFTIMFVRFLVDLKSIQGGPKEKGHAFLEVLILSITVVVIAVPEGLPLTVTLALAFATTRMLKDNNLFRLLRSCEIMGNATTVCSDKTGTLTTNQMSVVTDILGSSIPFHDALLAPAANDDDDAVSPSTAETIRVLPSEVKELLKTAFVINSTAIETSERSRFIGSSTETALLKFALDHLGLGSLDEERANGNIVQVIPFDASRKWMAVIVKLGDGRHRMLVKGAAEVVLARCTEIVRDPTTNKDAAKITPDQIQMLDKKILSYARRSLRVVTIAYRDFDEWPLQESLQLNSLPGLVFFGAFGMRDPLRPEVIESVRQCQSAGVFVRMVTGDNFFTAIAIASECGIYTAGGITMDGPTFRKLSPMQLDLVVPRLQVLARSSPDDKLRLVSHLKSLDEIVAVTGDGTNDALALKAADVGFSMGVSGTEVAKEASAIVLMDDNFASIAKAISWGRAVNDAAKKFLQFQFTINVSAGILTVISALVGGTESSVFRVVQLLWINLIMDTFAALALGTDFPTPDLLKRRPEPRGISVLDTTMWKMIFGQSLYQLAVIFTFHYAGERIFQYHTERQLLELQTMIFNIYVWMQFFNQIK